MGDMHMELFSANAVRESATVRVKRAESFAERIKAIHADLNQVSCRRSETVA
jgi:hypothetical protein